MPRFFVEEEIPAEATNWGISGDDARHMRTVLRMVPGDELTLCDGRRTDIQAKILALTSNVVELSLGERRANQTESPLEIWLFQGLPKSDKMDSIIQKSVELGVSRIIPVACERSVAKIEARDVARKTERWNKIAREAAKQCGRGLLPLVEAPVSFREAIRLATDTDLALIPWESERDQSIRRLLTTEEPRLLVLQKNGQRPRVAILIGPEGGFSRAEIEHALESGLHPVTLGQRILRTETAGPAVLAMLGYQFEPF
ncbi:MAG: 16S rRNA (uracil(1498)-N(3))-methyltransferase [Clostridia bacterium]|nr:16S rRNA (uracil(1498)-N(3))-methyltransferase [Clostridia bacterium]